MNMSRIFCVFLFFFHSFWLNANAENLDIKVAENLSIQSLFSNGMESKNGENYSDAELYFRAALDDEPNAGRIRLELAEVLAQQSKFAEARRELEIVKASNPPEAVQQNIDEFLRQITAVEADPRRRASFSNDSNRSWNAFISAGLGYDSNVNGGPDDDSIFLYGLPFRLSNDAQETDDEFWTLSGGINHRLPINETVSLQSSLRGSFTDYFNADPYDTFSVQAASGPSFKIGKQALLSVPLTARTQSYTDSGETWYSSSFGVAPQLRYALNKNTELGFGASLSRRIYDGNSERNLTAWSVNPYLVFRPVLAGSLRVGFNYGQENSGLDIYSNDVIGGYVSYEHKFQVTPKHAFTASVNASYTETRFDGIQAAFTEARHDSSPSITGSLSYALPFDLSSSITASASYQNNNSNLDINEYDRTRFSLTFTKRF